MVRFTRDYVVDTEAYADALNRLGYVFYDTILWFSLDIRKDKINWSYLKTAFRKGKDMVIDKLFGRVTTLLYNHMASYLDDSLYAVHCICYGVVTNTEEFTNNFYLYCLAKIDRAKDNFKQQGMYLIEKYGKFIVLLEYSTSILFLLFYHGKVPYLSCLPWLLLYMTECISLVLFESGKAVLCCYSRTEYLRYGGLTGLLSRIPFTWCLYKLGLGLWGFALALTVDFLLRGIYFYTMADKHEKYVMRVEKEVRTYE